jgi:hypothetical protein
MGYRAGVSDVKSIITAATHDEQGTAINLTAFIRAANLLTNKVQSNDTGGLLNANDLKEIETYLAAHFYTFRDQQYASSKTDDSSDTYQGQTGMYFESSFYGQTAKMLDVTGYLANLEDKAKKGRKKVDITWLGKPKSAQIPYEQRD